MELIILKPITDEKRADIVRLKQKGKKDIDISEWLDISVGVVKKIWSQFIHTSDYSAKPYKGRKSTISADVDEKIIAEIEKEPSVTLKEIIEKFELNITESGLSKRLKKMGYTFKKRLSIQKHKSEKMLPKSVLSGQNHKKI